MLVKLDLPFVDARAADLALALDAPRQDAISTLTIKTPALRAELRLLGCSHQAIVTAEHYELSELVACRPGSRGPLPPHASERRDGHNYEFRADTQSLTAEEFAREARRLMAEVAGRDDSLVGKFPGPDGAFTALSFKAGGTSDALAWESWHGYPQTSEIVYTASAVQR